MATSIFDIQPTVINSSLAGKYILLYSKPKLGKTTFASQFPKNLILATEWGVNAIAGVKALPIFKWTDIKSALKELKQPRGREMYSTITIDTISQAITLCEDYICAREGVNAVKDIPWG